MLVTRTSGMTGNVSVMDIDFTQEEAKNFASMTYKEIIPGMGKWTVPGLLIQDAFPNLNADQREFLMTGITPAEWNETFGNSEKD